MSCFKALTSSRAIVITIALGPKVEELLLPIGTTLNHLLLTRFIGRNRTVTLHL
jgi:hypothetical protein